MPEESNWAKSMGELAGRMLENPLKRSDTIRWQCNQSGRCCHGTPVLVSPHDVWRMVVDDVDAMAKFGITTTGDLFDSGRESWRKNPRPSYLSFYLGNNSNLPVVSIAKRKNEKDDSCPFLVPAAEGALRPNEDAASAIRSGRLKVAKTVDGKTKEVCGIHGARPTICRAYPFGRMLAGKDGKNGKPKLSDMVEHLADNRDTCKECYLDSDQGPENTIGEFLDACGVTEGFSRTDRWWKILDIINEFQTEGMRFEAGLFAFHFDRPFLRLGLSLEEIRKRRAPSFDVHMDRIEAFAHAIVSQSFDAQKASLVAILGEDLWKKAGLDTERSMTGG